MPDIRGTVAPGFEALRQVFAEGQGADPGMAQLVVYRGGERVVDLWTQRADGAGPAYDGDTPTVLMSCTKAITATCVLRLAERGLIDVDAPVARYWPEFTAAGKADITIAQVMSHTSGLSVFDADAGMDAEAILDWERSVAALAAMSPLWPPGEACSYHAITLGFLLGEVVRRVSGKTVGTLVAEEIAGPLGIDLWVGLPDAQQGRIAEHARVTPAMTLAQLNGLLTAMGADTADRFIRSTVEGAVVTEALIDRMNQPVLRAMEVPAGNGIGTARALAKFYAAVIGEIDGVRLLSHLADRRPGRARCFEGDDPHRRHALWPRLQPAQPRPATAWAGVFRPFRRWRTVGFCPAGEAARRRLCLHQPDRGWRKHRHPLAALDAGAGTGCSLARSPVLFHSR